MIPDPVSVCGNPGVATDQRALFSLHVKHNEIWFGSNLLHLAAYVYVYKKM